MRMSEGVEWALHACTVLAPLPSGDALPAARLAEFLGVPGPYLAKRLQALGRSGVLEAVPGKRGGYRLARSPEHITMLQVVLAVEGDESAFRCSEIRRRSPVDLPESAFRLPCGVARAMWAAEDAWRAELNKRTIADLAVSAAVGFTPKAIEQFVVWYEEGKK